jgi:hypothetical protein
VVQERHKTPLSCTGTCYVCIACRCRLIGCVTQPTTHQPTSMAGLLSYNRVPQKGFWLATNQPTSPCIPIEKNKEKTSQPPVKSTGGHGMLKPIRQRREVVTWHGQAASQQEASPTPWEGPEHYNQDPYANRGPALKRFEQNNCGPPPCQMALGRNPKPFPSNFSQSHLELHALSPRPRAGPRGDLPGPAAGAKQTRAAACHTRSSRLRQARTLPSDASAITTHSCNIKHVCQAAVLGQIHSRTTPEPPPGLKTLNHMPPQYVCPASTTSPHHAAIAKLAATS